MDCLLKAFIVKILKHIICLEECLLRRKRYCVQQMMTEELRLFGKHTERVLKRSSIILT